MKESIMNLSTYGYDRIRKEPEKNETCCDQNRFSCNLRPGIARRIPDDFIDCLRQQQWKRRRRFRFFRFEQQFKLLRLQQFNKLLQQFIEQQLKFVFERLQQLIRQQFKLIKRRQLIKFLRRFIQLEQLRCVKFIGFQRFIEQQYKQYLKQ